MRDLGKIVKRICVSVLSAIAGVSVAGCGGGGTTPRNMDDVCLYGPPRVTVAGRVTQSNGSPIGNICIVQEGEVRTRSAADGTFTADCGWLGTVITIQASDSDGPDNAGEFASQTIDLGKVTEQRKQVDIVMQPKSDSAE